MAAIFFAAVLSQAPSLPCAACGFAHAHLASTFESLKGSNNIPAAMEDEIEQLCQTDDQLSAYAPLRRACESLLEKYDEALILSAMAGEAAGTACLRFVESKDCDGEAAKAAMARFSVPITSEAMPEGNDDSWACKGLVRRLVRSSFPAATRQPGVSLVVMLYRSTDRGGDFTVSDDEDENSACGDGPFDAVVAHPYHSAVSEFYKFAKAVNNQVDGLQLAQLDTRANAPPPAVVLPDVEGVQFVVYRHKKERDPRALPVSLPHQDEGEDGARQGQPRSLANVADDEVRRQLFELLYGVLHQEQVALLQKRVYWDVPTKITATATPATKVTTTGGEGAGLDTSAANVTCVVCERMLLSVMRSLGGRKRTELEVVDALDGVCERSSKEMGLKPSYAGEYTRACYDIQGTYGEQMERSLLSLDKTVESRNMRPTSFAREVCAASGIQYCLTDAKISEAAAEEASKLPETTYEKSRERKRKESARRLQESRELRSNLDDVQRCEVCGVLVHEAMVARQRKIKLLRKQEAKRVGGEHHQRQGQYGQQARKRMEAAEKHALGKVVNQRMTDVCEGEVAFIVCDEHKEEDDGTFEGHNLKGTSSLRTPPNRKTLKGDEDASYVGWDECVRLALKRCSEVDDAHHEELVKAVVQHGEDKDRAGGTVATCARLLPGCQGERANVHMSHVAERAAYAEVEMESKDARFADSAMTEDIVMEGDYKEEL